MLHFFKEGNMDLLRFYACRTFDLAISQGMHTWEPEVYVCKTIHCDSIEKGKSHYIFVNRVIVKV